MLAVGASTSARNAQGLTALQCAGLYNTASLALRPAVRRAFPTLVLHHPARKNVLRTLQNIV